MARKKTTFEEDAFVQQIVATPDDDAPRLIYADWLEERGDPRGEFIRLQCQRAAITRHHPDWENLLAKESALLKRFGSEWQQPIQRYASHARFERGFIEHIEVAAIPHLRCADSVFRMFPTIRSLKINHLRDLLGDVATSPWMDRIVNLDLSDNELGGRALRALVQSPFCQRLAHLKLNRCLLNQVSVACFADAPNFKLTYLDVANNSLGASGADMLAGSQDLASLRRLNVASNHIDGTELIALTKQPTFRLEFLSINSNQLGNEGVAAIAQCQQYSELKTLDLGNNRISNVGIQALAASPYLGKLEVLMLDNNRISDNGVKVIASSTTLANLVELNLSTNEFSQNAAQELSATGNFPRMRALAAWPH